MGQRSTSWPRQVVAMVRVAVIAQLTYRASTVQLIVSSALYQSVQLAFLGLIILRFGTIGGWSSSEILLLFAARSCSHGLYTVLFWQVQSIDSMLREGRFDHFLHRPVPVFLQVVCGGFTVATLGDVLIGVAILSIALPINPGLDSTQLGFLVVAIVTGGMVEAAIQIALAALAFPLRQTLAIRVLVDGVMTDLGGIPLDALGRTVAIWLTVGLPLGLISYLPVAFVLGKETFAPAWAAPLALLAGPLLLAASVAVFNFCLRFYDSPNGMA